MEQPNNQNQNQGQPPMGGGGGSNLSRYEQAKAPQPGAMENVQNRLQQYGGGQDRRSQIDAALAQAQGGGQTSGQTINSGQTGTPGMGSQAPGQQGGGQQVGYQNIQNTPDQNQQRTIDTINAMQGGFHGMSPDIQQYYTQQLGYNPQQMQQQFPAPGVQVPGQNPGQVPMGGALVGGAQY